MNRKTLFALLVMASCSHKDETALDIVIEAQPSFRQVKEEWDWQSIFQKAPRDKEQKILSEKIVTADDHETSEESLKEAQRLLVLGRSTEAQSLLKSAYRKDKNHLPTLLTLIETSLKVQDLATAEDLFHQAKKQIEKQQIDAKATTIRYRYNLAQFLELSHKSAEAKKIYSTLIKQEPLFSPAYVGLAQIYLSQEKWDLAEFICQRAIDVGAPMAAVYNILGVVEAQRGKLQDAVSRFQHALSIDETHTSSMINLAQVQMTLGHLEVAESLMIRASQAALYSSESFLALARVQSRLGKRKLATASLERALQIDPLNAAARLELALHQPETNRERAIQLLEQVISQNEAPTRRLAEARLQDLLSKGE